MSNLTDLYLTGGQSPWLDNLRRDWLEGGELSRWIDRGVRGVTSNPSIFQKAMTSQDTYDDQFRQLLAQGSHRLGAGQSPLGESTGAGKTAHIAGNRKQQPDPVP